VSLRDGRARREADDGRRRLARRVVHAASLAFFLRRSFADDRRGPYRRAGRRPQPRAVRSLPLFSQPATSISIGLCLTVFGASQRRPDDVRGVLAGGGAPRDDGDPGAAGDELRLLRRRRRWAVLVPGAGVGARGAAAAPPRRQRRRRRVPPGGRQRGHAALPGRRVRAQRGRPRGPHARARRLRRALLLGEGTGIILFFKYLCVPARDD
jgi:hypothetical protein